MRWCVIVGGNNGGHGWEMVVVDVVCGCVVLCCVCRVVVLYVSVLLFLVVEMVAVAVVVFGLGGWVVGVVLYGECNASWCG